MIQIDYVFRFDQVYFVISDLYLISQDFTKFRVK